MSQSTAASSRMEGGSCDVCGRPLPPRVKGKAGAPRKTCDRTCWEIGHHLQALDNAVTVAADRFSPQGWLEFRKQVWAIASSRAWNKGLKAPRATPE